MTHVVQQQHTVQKSTRATRTLVRARTILARTTGFVVKGFRLLGGPFFAGGHDTGTLRLFALNNAAFYDLLARLFLFHYGMFKRSPIFCIMYEHVVVEHLLLYCKHSTAQCSAISPHKAGNTLVVSPRGVTELSR